MDIWRGCKHGWERIMAYSNSVCEAVMSDNNLRNQKIRFAMWSNHAAIGRNMDCACYWLSRTFIFSSRHFLWYGKPILWSFSLLISYPEGLNGRLPNQDLLNSVNVIATNTGGTKVVLYDFLEEDIQSSLPEWMSGIITSSRWARDYAVQARSIIKHMSYQALGRASGIHGLFHQ
jgi:Gaa1-like, GPI transamidase component